MPPRELVFRDRRPVPLGMAVGGLKRSFAAPLETEGPTPDSEVGDVVFTSSLGDSDVQAGLRTPAPHRSKRKSKVRSHRDGGQERAALSPGTASLQRAEHQPASLPHPARHGSPFYRNRTETQSVPNGPRWDLGLHSCLWLQCSHEEGHWRGLRTG